jgi:hypothetical protein
MGEAVPPLPQYAFMAWCSVRGAQGDGPSACVKGEDLLIISVSHTMGLFST